MCSVYRASGRLGPRPYLAVVLLTLVTPCVHAGAGVATVTLSTTCGDIVISVDTSVTDKAGRCFVRNCERGAYTGTVFEKAPRLLFAGAVRADGSLGTGGAALPDREIAGAKVRRGTVGFRPYTSTTGQRDGYEFFIATEDCADLDGKLTVVGTVSDGLAALDDITAATSTVAISSVSVSRD